jgi:hypothetical protein
MKKRICRQQLKRLESRFLHQGCVFLPHPLQGLPFVSGQCSCAPSASATGALIPQWGTRLGWPWWVRSCPVAVPWGGFQAATSGRAKIGLYLGRTGKGIK